MAWIPIDKEKFKRAYLAGLKDHELATLSAGTSDQVNKYLRVEIKEGRLPKRGSFVPTKDFEGLPGTDPVDLRIIQILSKAKVGLEVADLANQLDISPKRVEDAISRLQMQHYLVEMDHGAAKLGGPSAGGRSIRQSEYLDNSRIIRFGIVSDSHLCSKYARLDLLETMFDIFEQRGIHRVFSCGNDIDGERRFNKNDIHIHGMGNQVRYWAENWPKRTGITTEFICGDDHEGWYVQDQGIDIGWVMEMTAREKYGRTDLRYLGYMEHDVIFESPEGGKTVVRLQHPGGGSAYALSYTPQKIVESLTGGDKPHVLFLGHYHKHGHFFIRNIHTILCGCFQDQSPFMRKKRLAAHLGGYIIELQQAPDGSVLRIQVEFVPFFDNPTYDDKWVYKMAE